MNKKIICFCVCMLVIATSIPVVGSVNIEEDIARDDITRNSTSQNQMGGCYEDVIVIDSNNKLAYFGCYRASFMIPYEDHPIYWDLIQRTVEWAVDFREPNDTKIALFTHDGDCCGGSDEGDACSVLTYLLDLGYTVDEYHQMEIEEGSYFEYDLALYWSIYGYDCQNILDQQIPLITSSTHHVKTMNIGFGGSTHGITNQFNIVNNNYYPTESYDLGPLIFGEIWYDTIFTIGNGTSLVSAYVGPYKPNIISGPENGKTGEINTFTASAKGSDLYIKMFYKWDWGDGTTSKWLGPYHQYEKCEAKHIWLIKGPYEIRVKVKDEKECESPYSNPWTLNITLTRAINNPFLKFLEIHPNLFPILQRLLKL